MNTNKKKPAPVNQLQEAKPFLVDVETKGQFVIIKLPKNALDYLNLDDETKVNVLPINNTLQITSNNILTGIPALDLNHLENQFVAQPA